LSLSRAGERKGGEMQPRLCVAEGEGEKGKDQCTIRAQRERGEEGGEGMVRELRCTGHTKQPHLT
jgi:hypothetical protein